MFKNIDGLIFTIILGLVTISVAGIIASTAPKFGAHCWFAEQVAHCVVLNSHTGELRLETRKVVGTENVPAN